VIDEAELRQMSPEERADLARALADLNAESLAPNPISQRRRRLLIAASLGGALILAVWIGVLEVKLPRLYRANGWQASWVGFDIGLLMVFLATAWAAWRRRQVLIGCLMVLATLLVCDAWFDTMLDYGTRGFMVSLLSALVIELPLAVVALTGARRLLRLTIGRLEQLEGGGTGKLPAFWQVPLFGDHSGSYRVLLHKSPSAAADGDADEPEAETPRPRTSPAARGVAAGETCG